MQGRLLILLSFLTVVLVGPGLQTGWAGDAPWLSKGGSFDACLLRSSQNLNQERLANIGFGQFRGTMDNEWDVMVGCLRTNVDFDLSGNFTNRVPKGKLSYTIEYDWLSRVNNVGEQGQVKFKEKRNATLGVKFGSKMLPAPTGYNNWTQYIRMDYELGGMDLLLGWNVKAKGKGKARDFVVCGGYVLGFDANLPFNSSSAEERLVATLMAQAKAEIETLAKLERQEP